MNDSHPALTLMAKTAGRNRNYFARQSECREQNPAYRPTPFFSAMETMLQNARFPVRMT